VIITSPTYEGVISDIATIADIVHEQNIPLLVDGAHGAHLGLSACFPDDIIRTGADVVVMSLHKTLPALTQCSLLHASGKRAKTAEIEGLLSVLQTSSPSYVLMASIDYCLRLLESDKERLFSEYKQNLDAFNRSIMVLKNLSVLNHGTSKPIPGFFSFDLGKLVIATKNTILDGVMLTNILRKEYNIELELAFKNYAIAMTSICDHPEGFTRLADALIKIDHSITQPPPSSSSRT